MATVDQPTVAVRRSDPNVECPIILACDAAYAMPLATTLRSIAESRGSDRTIEAYIISSGIDGELRARVSHSLPVGAFDIHWLDIDVGRFAGFFTLPHLSKMAFARLLIGELLPAHVKKILYLDVDLLILSDLAPLLTTELNGHALGAVHDRCDRKIKDGDPDFHNVPRVSEYFNSGVLLIDLPLWREHRISEKALAFLETNQRTPFSDQDALNVAADGDWMPLDPRWNFQRHYDVVLQQLNPSERPSIVHFVMAEKPWIAKSMSINASFYDAYRARTLFRRSASQRLTDFLTSVALRARTALRPKRSAYGLKRESGPDARYEVRSRDAVPGTTHTDKDGGDVPGRGVRETR